MHEVVAHLRRRAAVVVPLSLGFACSAAVNYGIAYWLATFFIRTHGWTAQRAGVLQGSLTATVGVFGALAGADASTAR